MKDLMSTHAVDPMGAFHQVDGVSMSNKCCRIYVRLTKPFFSFNPMARSAANPEPPRMLSYEGLYWKLELTAVKEVGPLWLRRRLPRWYLFVRQGTYQMTGDDGVVSFHLYQYGHILSDRIRMMVPRTNA